MVVLHALLLWAVQAGLHRTVVQKLPTVVQALLLEEKRPEPPPPPAEPPKAPPQVPPPKTPPPPAYVPPAYVPPVEVPAPVAPPKAIVAVSSSPPPVAASVNPAPVAQLTPTPPSSPAPAATPPSCTVEFVNKEQCSKHEYPNASRRMEEEGTVALRLLVGIDGKVIQSEIDKSSGYKRLDEAARAGMSKCLFRPPTVDGKPVQCWASIRHVWRLE